PGANHTFTFNYAETGAGSGTLSLTAHAGGTDTVTGNPVQSADATTSTAAVQTPASLQVTGFSLPGNLSRGQTFQAMLTVTNSGEATALNVVPSPNPPSKTITGGADASTSTSPAAQTIAGGSSAVFTWTYTENGTGSGTLRLTTGAVGTDANTSGAISAPTQGSNTAQVQAPAALVVTSFTVPSAVLRGTSFTASMVVTNTGGAAAQNVIPLPNPPAVTATGSAAASSTTPESPVTIAGGASHTFSWAYNETGTEVGTLQLSAAVSGQDANSGAALSVPTTSSNTASVQNPGGLVITDFSFPTALSRGQTFTLSMTVQNSGGSTVNNVAPLPNPPALNATGGANASTSSSPAPVPITPGASHTFSWSYTETGSGTGTLQFTGAAQGTGSVSGSTITAGTVSTSTAQVQAPASLTVTSITAPATLSRGQSFTVQMVVSNGGQATATNVLPSPIRPTVQSTGQAGASSTDSPAAQSIPGGSTATFTWTFTENGTNTGTLRFTGGAAGTDANSGAAVTAPQVQSAASTVQTPAALSITSFTIPSTIVRRTSYDVVLAVRNNGQAAADLVIPSPNPPAEVSTGGAGGSTSTTVTPVSIAGGASHSFTWTYVENGSGPGTLQYTAGATGTDANSGAALSAASASTPVATVQEPADLEITSFTLSGTTLSVGQAFTASVTVHNRGGTTASGVLPSPNPPALTSTGGAGAATSTVLTPFDLAAGASHAFTGNYSATGGAGTRQLTTGATGTDAITGATVTAPSASTPTATVQTPAALAVTSFTIPPIMSRGQAFTAVMVVTNSGQAAANNVLPSPLRPIAIGTGGAGAGSSDSPAAQSIPGGGNATFQWTYTENGTGAGTLKLNGGAQGTDANSGIAVSAAAADSTVATVQQPAALAVTSFTAPSAVMRGGSFTLTMVVTNSGQATANGVLPSPATPALNATGGAGATTTSPQTPATIAGGATATFTWSYLENGTGTGTLTFSAGASGTDANSGAAASAASADSNAVSVQTPPDLVVTAFTAAPSLLSRGQAFTVSMVVQNQGGTTASGVLPSPDPPALNVLSGSPGATTGTSLAPADIAAGASHTFTWSYTENGTAAGAFTLTAGASGTNAVTGTTVTAPALSTDSVPVQDPTSLSITSFTIPDPIGTSFTATMVVQNGGQATAIGVVPTLQPPVVTGGASVTLSAGPTPQTIIGGNPATFTWTYDVTGPGTVYLTAGLTGADANSGATVTAASQDSNTATIPVRPPPDVDATLAVRPRIAEPGQSVTVTLELKPRSAGMKPVEVTAPAALSLDGPAEVALVSGPQVARVTVAAGQAQRFEWTYRAVRRGWVTFRGAASGLPEATSSHLTSPAPWCAAASSLLAFAGPGRSGRCHQPLALGGSPSAAGGAGTYRYEWSPADGLSSALAANPTATPRVALAEYQLTVTDADGCQARDAVRAEVTDAPRVALGGEASGAPGERLSFSRSLECPAGGCSDFWELGNGKTSTSASPSARYGAEGAYAVRYRTTDASGCEASAEWPVVIGAP
ncbi:MAG TPA: PKD domain-containing protein, partial [Myxococcales bacterium]|nr:PKD domain-containing protein [Myxococcales bacterium]